MVPHGLAPQSYRGCRSSAGVRIAVGKGSAYDLYLTRTIKNATLVRAAYWRRARDD